MSGPFWWSAGIVGVALLAGVACSPGPEEDRAGVTPIESRSPDASAAPDDTIDFPAALETSGWEATRVIDGDTLVVEGPDGDVTVRIIGINTPERGECFADEATDALEELVDGEELELVEDVSDLDQYGRALRYVETTSGVDVGAELVADGMAIARRYEPDVDRSSRYQSLQERARTDRRGLWARDACGSGASDPVAIVIDVNADAPGGDNEDLNGEWVRFTNRSDAPVDLDGWQVADESATHRYVFADRTLASAGSVTLFTGCGVDDDEAVYWCKTDSAVWNNSGDTVFLRDANGNIAAVLGYGESVGS